MRHVTIPQNENLTIEAISKFVTQYGEVGDYLPDPIENPKIPKAWIANICASWVAKKVNERNEELVVKKKLVINMDPEIAAVFKASTKTSGRPLIFYKVLIVFF